MSLGQLFIEQIKDRQAGYNTSKYMTILWPGGAIMCHSQVVSGSYSLGYPGDCNRTSSPGLTSMGGLVQAVRSG